MKFETYQKGQAICLAEGKCIDCVYIFYTIEEGREVLPDLTPNTIDIMCNSTCGVLRTRGVICKTVDDSNLQITFTSKGGEKIGVNTPEFTAGAKIYNVVLAISGNTYNEDVLMVSTPLTPYANVPAGTQIVMDVTVKFV